MVNFLHFYITELCINLIELSVSIILEIIWISYIIRPFQLLTIAEKWIPSNIKFSSSSIALYFLPKISLSLVHSALKVKNMTYRAFKLFHNHTETPPMWEYTNEK